MIIHHFNTYCCAYMKTSELVPTSLSQNGVWWRQRVSFTTEKLHQSAVKTEQLCRACMVKTESLCVCTQYLSSLHTHTFGRLQSWVANKTHKHWIHLHLGATLFLNYMYHRTVRGISSLKTSSIFNPNNWVTRSETDIRWDLVQVLCMWLQTCHYFVFLSQNW